MKRMDEKYPVASGLMGSLGLVTFVKYLVPGIVSPTLLFVVGGMNGSLLAPEIWSRRAKAFRD